MALNEQRLRVFKSKSDDRQYLKGKMGDATGNCYICHFLSGGAQVNRALAHAEENGVEVSTVALGYDHRFNGDLTKPPLIFGTFVSGGLMDGFVRLYETRDDALKGHDHTAALAFKAPDAESDLFKQELRLKLLEVKQKHTEAVKAKTKRGRRRKAA